ncbi:MAG: ACT domain-containing protein [Sedimentisphaerales bacterium]|nr:ACT domain-containing protein [Sedimentisphaerales bacterium]
MKINQLSVFLENKPGRLSEPCEILAANGINILTLSLADTEQFGILRLVVKEWEKAKRVLEEAGTVVNVTEVVALEVADRPGGLEDVLKVIESGDINVEYMYAFTTFSKNKRAILVFRFEDADRAVAYLRDHDVNVIDSVSLYQNLK